MMTLSKLNQELEKANNYKSKLTEDYNRKLQEANNHINRLETDIRSFISVGDANTYNQLKSATELLTPLGYQDSIKSVVFLLNSGFKVYLKDFKEMLIKTLDPKNKDNDYNNLLLSDLEIQDNSYGGDPTKYTNMTRKGYSTNYHPCLGGLEVSKNATPDELENLLLVVSKLLSVNSMSIYRDEQNEGWNTKIINKFFLDPYAKNFLQLLFPKVNFDTKDIELKIDNTTTQIVNFENISEKGE